MTVEFLGKTVGVKAGDRIDSFLMDDAWMSSYGLNLFV